MVHLDHDGPWLAPAGVIAGVCLGWALQISNGFLNERALALVALAFALFFAAVLLPRVAGPAAASGAPFLRTLAVIGLALQVTLLATSSPAMYLRADEAARQTFTAGVAALGLVGAAILWSARGWRFGILLAGLVAIHFALGVWILRHSPNPAIDVHLFHRYAIDALRSGENPYAITFPDIYRTGDFYGPGLSIDGRLQFGFPYFPLTLLISVPGQVFGKDPRFAQLATMEVAAILMACARPRGFGPLAAVLYLTSPRIFFVLEQSWTEPIVVFGLAVVTVAACRWTRAVPFLFGAFVALKQYLVFALPAACLLVGAPIRWRRVVVLLAKGAAVGGAITLPFVLWNPAAFWKSVVALQFHQPFRGDALSVLAWWAAQGHPPPSSAVAFAVAAAAAGLAVWRLPRTAAGFSAAVAATFFAFFATNKQAFCNYYFFVVGALFVTVSAVRPPERRA